VKNRLRTLRRKTNFYSFEGP